MAHLVKMIHNGGRKVMLHYKRDQKDEHRTLNKYLCLDMSFQDLVDEVLEFATCSAVVPIDWINSLLSGITPLSRLVLAYVKEYDRHQFENYLYRKISYLERDARVYLHDKDTFWTGHLDPYLIPIMKGHPIWFIRDWIEEVLILQEGELKQRGSQNELSAIFLCANTCSRPKCFYTVLDVTDATGVCICGEPLICRGISRYDSRVFEQDPM